MHLLTGSNRLPCWVTRPSLLKQDVRHIVMLQVRTLNKAYERTEWLKTNLTTTARAELILMGLNERFGICCKAENVDDFVRGLGGILWPDIVYQRRAKILAADAAVEAAEVDDPYTKDADHESMRETAYRTCAIEVLADVLDGVEKARRSGKGTTGQPPPRKAKTKELPNWVRCPDLLYRSMDDRVISIIKEVRDEPAWKRKITTEERARIIRARLQRRFDGRVSDAVMGERPGRILVDLFDTELARQLLPFLRSELKARRRRHSCAWNQMNGVWYLVEFVLLGLMEKCERNAGGKYTMTDRLCDWFRDRVVGRLTLDSTSDGVSSSRSWGRYTV
ncbi:hypothetical protein EKO27_g8058 [Xylaria grammica]|uniref:Uncharacterized protein n=1 Tax=Xylaria grammica TaxID=363999 RepID=A0A439CYE4_9PEZI|nr:hypothetical protein EKO27_g8058 [Xylaria grammica]